MAKLHFCQGFCYISDVIHVGTLYFLNQNIMVLYCHITVLYYITYIFLSLVISMGMVSVDEKKKRFNLKGLKLFFSQNQHI